jgi:hypothetical protein
MPESNQAMFQELMVQCLACGALTSIRVPLPSGPESEIESRDRTSLSNQNLKFFFLCQNNVTSDMWQDMLIESRIILISGWTHSYKTHFHHKISLPSLNHSISLYPSSMFFFCPGVVLLSLHSFSSFCCFKRLSLEKAHT